MSNRPNYFKLLRLHPGANWGEISARIDEKKNECNRVRTDAPMAEIREANAFKIYREDIENVLKNEAMRKN